MAYSHHYQRYDWNIESIEGTVIFFLIGGVVVCSVIIVGGISTTVFGSITEAFGGMMPDMNLAPEIASFFPDLSTAFPILDGFNDFADAIAEFDAGVFGFDNIELTLGHISEELFHMFELPPEVRSLFRF